MDAKYTPSKTFCDPATATLGVIEFSTLPFIPKRIYWMHDFQDKMTRGNHAHKTLRQLFVAIVGSVIVELRDGFSSQNFHLVESGEHLLVEPGYWRVIKSASPDAALLVIADQAFDENDYIRDWDTFVQWRTKS